MAPGLARPSIRAGDIDAVAHKVAVTLFHYVAQMDANPELYAALGWKPGITLEHAVLHLYGAPYGVDHAPKFNDGAVACPLDNTASMNGDDRIDEVASQRAQPSQYSILIGAGKPAVSDYIRYQNCREFPGLRHDAPSPQ